MSVTKQPPLPLGADGELVELGRTLVLAPWQICVLGLSYLDARVSTGQLGELDAASIVHVPQTHLPADMSRRWQRKDALMLRLTPPANRIRRFKLQLRDISTSLTEGRGGTAAAVTIFTYYPQVY